MERQFTTITENDAAELAELFRALGDSSRIKILAALAEGEQNVGSLAELAGLSESAASHHMRHLRQMRLVKTRRNGRFIYYTLDDDHIAELFRCGLEHVRHR